MLLLLAFMGLGVSCKLLCLHPKITKPAITSKTSQWSQFTIRGKIFVDNVYLTKLMQLAEQSQ
jgi:hypothetical protein